MRPTNRVYADEARKRRQEEAARRKAQLHDLSQFVSEVPGEDPFESGRTMSPEQLRLALRVLEIKPLPFRRAFNVGPVMWRRWLHGERAIPPGIVDYLRRRIADRIRATADIFQLKVSLQSDIAPPLSAGGMAALDALTRLNQQYADYTARKR